MHNRVVMAKYDPSQLVVSDDPGCNCGVEFDVDETILLYPIPEAGDWRIREMVCMTCHFWFTHEVLESLND